MQGTDHYTVECVCGKEVKSRSQSFTCPHCKRPGFLVWPSDPSDLPVEVYS